MFDIGYQELLVLAVLAIIVVGPKDLPGFLRTIGKYFRQIKRQIADVQREVTKAIDTEEINALRKDLNSAAKFDPLEDVKKDLDKATDFGDLNFDGDGKDTTSDDVPEQKVRKFVPKSHRKADDKPETTDVSDNADKTTG